MKNLKRFIALFTTIMIMLMMTMSVFAITLNANGHTVGRSGTNIVIDGTTYNCTGTAGQDDEVIVGGNKFYCLPSEKSAIQNALSANVSKDSTSMGEIQQNAVNEVKSLQDSLGKFAPSISKGINALGDDTISAIQVALSIGVGALWIIYLAVLIINGAVILIPGFADKAGATGSSGGYGGMGGYGGSSSGDKGSNIFKAAVWNSTKKIANSDCESPIKEFIKATIPSMIFMVVLTVCLFNGLLIRVITFFLNFFKMGG